jgi:hypothetical protein
LSKTAFRILVGKKPLGRPRQRWEDSVEMGRENVDLIHLAQDSVQQWTLVNTVMSLQIP